jgi:hypothetical protein
MLAKNSMDDTARACLLDFDRASREWRRCAPRACATPTGRPRSSKVALSGRRRERDELMS